MKYRIISIRYRWPYCNVQRRRNCWFQTWGIHTNEQSLVGIAPTVAWTASECPVISDTPSPAPHKMRTLWMDVRSGAPPMRWVKWFYLICYQGRHRSTSWLMIVSTVNHDILVIMLILPGWVCERSAFSARGRITLWNFERWDGIFFRQREWRWTRPVSGSVAEIPFKAL